MENKMQFKSFMEALKGKQHKIDKNKNGQIDAHDFKLLRKEDTEESNESFDFDRAALSKQKLQNLRSSGRKVRGASIANLMRSSGLREEELDEAELDYLEEVLAADATAGDYISDFVHSTNPKFNGKSKKERMNMALGAYYSTQKKKDGVSEGMSHQAATTMKHIPNASDKLKQAAKDIKPGIKGYLDRVAMLKAGGVKEQAPVAPVPDKKYIKGTPENKALKDSRKPINGMPTNMNKEEAEQIEEKSDQAKQNKTMKNMMDASRGARFKLNNPVPDAEPEHKTAQAHNKAIGRSLRNEETKDDVPFDGPYKTNFKKPNNPNRSPMDSARALAQRGMAASKLDQKAKSKIKEEKDEQEYGYEGDMALNQLATLTRCAEMIEDMLKPDTDLPEWVQSKITLATDYIQTAADYLYSENEMKEETSVNVDKVNVAGHKPHEEKFETFKKPKKVKESFDDEGNLIPTKISYKDFITEIKLADLPVRKIQGHSYGANYSDPEGADDYDDKKPMKPAADKRGRGRPAGAKSGARKIMGTSKLTNK